MAVTRREKRACGRCAASGVALAPLPPAIIAKGLAGDAIVVEALMAKYCDHLPLYRQSVMLQRESGVEISRATLDGWVMQVGESLQPLVAAMGRRLLEGAPDALVRASAPALRWRLSGILPAPRRRAPP